MSTEMSPIRAVLFDLDGTLIDSIRLILDSYHHTFAVFGLPPRSDDEWLSGVGTPLAAQFSAWAGDEEALSSMIAAYRSYNLAHHDERVRPYPDAALAVKTLRRAGIRVGVVTSKNRSGTRRGLALAGIEDEIEVMVCVDDVTNGKPHREPVDKALTLLGVEAREAIFVGDSVHDMQAGRAAEVRTGAALWGPFERSHLEGSAPDHWFSGPMDVVRLVLG